MQSLKDVEKEIDSRSEAKKQIRERIGAYVSRKYGIPNFWELVDEFFSGQNKSFAICLARQIPTVDIENTAMEMTAKWMSRHGISTEGLPLAFINDSFTGANPEKLHYLKQKFLKRGRKKIYIQGEKITMEKNFSTLDGSTLSKISTSEGKSVPEHHFEQREEAGLTPAIDLSGFFLKCLQGCLRNQGYAPDHVFVEGENIKECKVKIEDLNGHKVIRPPADWYYSLYLFCFLDGERALLETTDNEPSVTEWIEKTKNEAEKICGFKPLILKSSENIVMKEFKSNLYEIPEWVLKDKEWRKKLEYPNSNSTILEAHQHFGRQLIERCPAPTRQN